MRAYTGGGPDLVWYGAAGDRTKTSINAFGIVNEFRGVLVRDDYGGYTSYDADLAGVQQCLAHVLRYLDDAHAIDTDAQAWARQVADALRAAIHEINTTRDGSSARPTRCGCSPPDSTSRPRTTGRRPRSAGSSLPPRSKGAGAPWPPCNAIAGSGPTSSAPATTDADPSTPSATPCPPTPGCHPK